MVSIVTLDIVIRVKLKTTIIKQKREKGTR